MISILSYDEIIWILLITEQQSAYGELHMPAYSWNLISTLNICQFRVSHIL